MKIKSTLFFFLLGVAELASAAVLKPGVRYDSYTIQLTDVPVLKLIFITDYKTWDTCNAFGLSGGLRLVSGALDSAQQDFVADFGVVGTEMPCRPGAKSRKLQLVSAIQEIRSTEGVIDTLILVPENYRIEILEPR